MNDIEHLTPEQRAAIPRLIRQSVVVADYGLGNDGCPFCGRIVEHQDDCVAVLFGATRGRLTPEADDGSAGHRRPDRL